MINNPLYRPMGTAWDDRATETMPCRCNCGRTVQRTTTAPKTAYYSEGCKLRHTKLREDGKRLKAVLGMYAPLYQYCPVFSCFQVLRLAKLIQARNPGWSRD
jgi:hypothetical protein